MYENPLKMSEKLLIINNDMLDSFLRLIITNEKILSYSFKHQSQDAKWCLNKSNLNPIDINCNSAILNAWNVWGLKLLIKITLYQSSFVIAKYPQYNLLKS